MNRPRNNLRLADRWGLIVLAGLFSFAAEPAGAATLAMSSTAARPIREREVAGETPSISFIDSPTATCYRPQEFGQSCVIQWNYLYVTAGASQYIVDMTVEIDGRVRAAFAGFFQSSMFVPSTMVFPGYWVTCGQPGAGGDPTHGRLVDYTIRARETGGLSSANYGSVLCPATRFIFADGFASGGSSAWSAWVP
ncbi:MAG: hypothetical protein KBA72_14525 [Thermoanaerobaculia bacterium]|nr:hypothetical protein [Thermoanaerobaculia bacterium]